MKERIFQKKNFKLNFVFLITLETIREINPQTQFWYVALISGYLAQEDAEPEPEGEPEPELGKHYLGPTLGLIF